MAKKQKLELRDVLALYQAFGPQVQQERQMQQQSGELQQLATLLGIAGGAQTLQDAPQEAALRRRASEAGINATETSTRLAGERAPVELEGLRAQIQQAMQSGALNTEQLKQLQATFPLQQELLGAQVQGAKVAAADAPEKIKREIQAQASDEGYRKTAGEAAMLGANAQMLPFLQSFMQTAGAEGGKLPGGLDLTPEIQNQVLAHVMKNPALASVFEKMGANRTQLQGAASAAVGTKEPYKIDKTKGLWERIGPALQKFAFPGIPTTTDFLKLTK